MGWGKYPNLSDKEKVIMPIVKGKNYPYTPKRKAAAKAAKKGKKQ